MSTRYPIKETVKVLTISKPGQKIRFQIRHPGNVYCINGITVTCTLIPHRTKEKHGTVDSIGHLSLAIPAKGDVVYSEDIQAHINFTDSLETAIYNGLVFRDFALSGKRMSYFDTQYLIQDAVLEGYYEDMIHADFSRKEFDSRAEALYQVSIYIRYLTLNQKNP